jgi:hypothetical protein
LATGWALDSATAMDWASEMGWARGMEWATEMDRVGWVSVSGFRVEWPGLAAASLLTWAMGSCWRLHLQPPRARP